MRIVNLLCFFSYLMVSCQSPPEQKARAEEKFQWNAGISSPKYYSAAPFVEYFYKGKSVAGASTNVGIGQGWGITMGGYTGGDKFKPVPDSVFVKWSSEVDDSLYMGGFKLPREKMLKLFQKGAIDTNGEKEEYTVIIGGTAPGGNVAIWMKAGAILTEIQKYKAKNKGIWMQNNKQYQDFKKKVENSKEYINSETSIFRYLHGVPYSVWEKGEKEYNYDIGFSSEEADKKDYSIAIAGYTKDGSLVYSSHDPIPYVNWNENINLKIDETKKLPVHFYLQWISRDDQQWYEAEIVLPNNLDRQLLEFQKQNGKDVFLIVGMDTVLKNEPYTFGRICLENSKTKTEIMKFRAAKLNVSKTRIRKYEVSKYSLPKGFVFPKWEGREPLTRPADLEYWQEK